MYSDRIVGEGYELDGNLFGVNKGFGISKERIDSMTDGIHLDGDIFSGAINYTNTWKLEYTSPLTLDDVKDEAEDDDGGVIRLNENNSSYIIVDLEKNNLFSSEALGV